MTSVAKVAKATAKAPRQYYYSVRMPLEMIEKCREIAGAETKRLGVPVAVAALLRKFISAGTEQWEKANGGGRG